MKATRSDEYNGGGNAAPPFFARAAQVFAKSGAMQYNRAMDYREITVFTTTQASELVADILTDLGSEGVGIYDKNDFLQLCRSEVVWDYVDESVLNASEVVRVCGYFPESAADGVEKTLAERLADLRRNCEFETGSLETSRRTVGDEDWNVVWRKFYSPIECGRIAVVPGWIDYKPEDGVTVVRMDPGMAFGTGEHETTRLCLRLMQDGDIQGARVADLGTGSGILAVAAAKLGAASVDACDIDEKAVAVAKSNCNINGVDCVRVEQADLLASLSGKYELILANITADILIRLADGVGAYLADGGRLIVSGIISARKQSVANAFLQNGFCIVREERDGEWNAMELKR